MVAEHIEWLSEELKVDPELARASGGKLTAQDGTLVTGVPHKLLNNVLMKLK